MIYLLETEYKDQKLYKIGYTDDISRRMKQHKTSNPMCELAMWKHGDTQDEANLHKLCEKWRYSTEWFLGIPEVKETFQNYVRGVTPIPEVSSKPYLRRNAEFSYEVPNSDLEFRVKELEYKLKIAELELENLKLRYRM